MDQLIKVARHPSSKGIHHEVHPFLHHLHLHDQCVVELYLLRMDGLYPVTLVCLGCCYPLALLCPLSQRLYLFGPPPKC